MLSASTATGTAGCVLLGVRRDPLGAAVVGVIAWLVDVDGGVFRVAVLDAALGRFRDAVLANDQHGIVAGIVAGADCVRRCWCVDVVFDVRWSCLHTAQELGQCRVVKGAFGRFHGDSRVVVLHIIAELPRASRRLQ